MPDREILSKIKASLETARDLELEVMSSEQRLSESKAQLSVLQHKVLPDQFNEAGISSLTLEASGNRPAMRCDLRPYFKAVIPARWSEEKRAEAMAELDKFGGGDIAKRVVSVAFPRGSGDDAESLAEELEKMGFSCNVTFEIPWQTLTSWLRETVSNGDMPDLEKIGGQVGQVVNLKKVEDE